MSPRGGLAAAGGCGEPPRGAKIVQKTNIKLVFSVSYPMHERRNSEKTNIKSTFSVSHPIHHPSPCAENNAKTNIKSTFSVLDSYPQHIRILVRMHKIIRKPIQYQHFRFGIQIRMHDTFVSYPMHVQSRLFVSLVRA